jgi:diaminopimelate epimerase
VSARPWPLPFWKYSAAGNDFIILEGRGQEPTGDPADLAKALCRRGPSVGADGLIVVESPRPGDPDAALARMRLWNADGSAAEISGNGARCVARFLVDQGAAPESIGFASDIGLVTAQVDGDICRLQLPTTARVFPGRRLRVEGRDLVGTYVEVGVPFFVCFHEDPDELAVRFLGRAIRNHPSLAPRGANVDFVRVEDEQRLYFRVYERGVEDETLSSGTGSISAALAAAAASKVSSPVLCVARGAELTVRFRRAGGGTPIPAGGTTASGPPTPNPDVDDVDDDDGDGDGDSGAMMGAKETAAGGRDASGRGVDVDAPAASGRAAAPTETSTALEDGDEEALAELPELVAGAEADAIRFVDLELEGDAMPIYRGEAFVQASRSPRRR